MLLVTELQFTQFKDTSEHSELRLLNQQQREEWWERKPGMLVTEWTHHMNIKKPQVGNKYVMAYFVLHFIPSGQQIIAQLV